MTDQTILAEVHNLVSQAKTEHDLQQVFSKYLGKKGVVTAKLKKLSTMPTEQRAQYGSQINTLKKSIEQIIADYKKVLSVRIQNAQAAKEAIDVTLPGIGRNRAKLHPISTVLQQIESIFMALGFVVEQGPEIENEYYNFTALNLPESHPARAMMDTFYIDDTHVLRTHTSPVQVRTMQKDNVPLRMICPGKVYRCDSDITHTPMFHQVEGLVIDKGISFANLKACMQTFVSAFFEKKVNIRFRASFFPFTEPSAEVDVECVKCDGAGCRICSYTGWIEILGCGLVNPKVLTMSNIDPKVYSGFAFGVGLERLAMLKYEVDDIRQFYDNDLTFLQQFPTL